MRSEKLDEENSLAEGGAVVLSNQWRLRQHVHYCSQPLFNFFSIWEIKSENNYEEFCRRNLSLWIQWRQTQTHKLKTELLCVL